MEHIDFDETIMFAWEWAEEFNAHLVRNDYHVERDSKSPHSDTLGLRPETIEQIGAVVAQHIQDHENPHVVKAAYALHLKSLQNYKKLPFMPRVYTNCEQVRRMTGEMISIGPALRWDTCLFLNGLSTDINEMIERHTHIHQTVERGFSEKSKMKM